VLWPAPLRLSAFSGFSARDGMTLHRVRSKGLAFRFVRWLRMLCRGASCLSLAVQCLLSGVVPTGTASVHALRRSTDRPTSKWVYLPSVCRPRMDNGLAG
jgi:hypothetical protein